jgi:hypothetical protein
MGRTTLDWLVTHDPSDTFTNRFFRLSDVRQSAQDCAWPEGIVFRNLRTKQVMIFQQGQLIRAATTSRPAQ